MKAPTKMACIQYIYIKTLFVFHCSVTEVHLQDYLNHKHEIDGHCLIYLEMPSVHRKIISAY